MNEKANNKFSLDWRALAILVTLFLAAAGFTIPAVYNRPDRQEVEKTVAAATAPKANKEDVVRLETKLEAVSKSQERIEAKLDKLLDHKTKRE